MTPDEVLLALTQTRHFCLQRLLVDELPKVGMEPALLEVLSTAPATQSVKDALEAMPALPGQSFATWLAERFGLGAPDLEPGMPVEALRGWADEEGLRWALNSHLGWALRDQYYVRVLPHRTVEELVTEPDRSAVSWARARDRAKEAVEWLHQCAFDAQLGRLQETALQPVYAAAPPPPFHDAWQRLYPRYLELWSSIPMGLWPKYRGVIHYDDPAISLEVHETLVTIPYEGLLPPIDDPVIELAALSGAIKFLVLDTSDRGELARVMAVPRWRRQLQDLEHYLSGDFSDAPKDDGRSVAWEVARDHDSIELHPVLCKITKAGKIQGRRVEAEALIGREGMSSADAEVASLLHQWRRPPREVVLEALELLAGHPRVIMKGRGAQEPVPVRSGLLQLELQPDGDGYELRLTVGGKRLSREELRASLGGYDAAGGRAAFVRERELLVARCTEDQRRMVLTLSDRSAQFPPEALGELLSLLPRLQQRMPVHLAEDLRGQPVAGDPRPLLKVRMEGQSLVVEARIQPLPDAPEYEPGAGPEMLHVVRDGLPRFHERALTDEPVTVRQVLHELGIPESARQGQALWAVDDPELALDVVRAMDPNRHRITLDASLPTVVDATTKELRLLVKGSGIGWFDVGGHVDSEVGKVNLKEILAAVREGRRYVPLGKGRFLHLEQALAAHARALDQHESGGETRIGEVHAPLLEQLEADGASVEGAPDWREVSDRLRQARTLAVPVPQTLDATLRPYQEEGLTWLVRQAAWAPGAVLCDDMGLGKTVQTIGLLLERAERGPALVVAPTSVVFNWAAELARFSPGLRVLHYLGPQREALLTDLRPGDVLLTSYGIMLRDGEALREHRFGTLVFDEAQALKTADSQRAKMARTLSGDFRLALSGTPVENHTVELWSLFSILVPGLFGPLSVFRNRFLGAKERSQRKALAELAGPFMLRRTKRLVAPELPERQEVSHTLELSEGHKGLYAVGVEGALARIAATPRGKRRFVIGQELMRLRQLACDPRLADPGNPFPGPKIRWLRRCLEAVRESGEQALVFSSYVGMLELAREALREDGYRVAWLTGATPQAARQAEVARFQGGEADVFLISLKAGGTGLNLTAASYVFILDPWWNPAAEDQAADRAHRIGQDKRVTIYRGIASGTVEEMILKLQADKRGLVEELMSGSSSSTVPSPGELLTLFSGAMA